MHRTLATCAALLALLTIPAAGAAEVRVLTAGAFKPVVAALAPAFTARTGHTVVIVNDTTGALVRRIAGDEAFDLVVLTPDGIAGLAGTGKVLPGSAVPLARVGIGVAVREGAAAPDIGTVDAFVRALLAARAVAYVDPASGGSSGIYLAGLFVRPGIADGIAQKAVLVPGGLVAARLVTGEADLALHQVSEILAVPGARLVGPIPAELQNWTVYAGAVGAGTRDVEAARAILQDLAGPEAAGVLRQKGMEAPPG